MLMLLGVRRDLCDLGLGDLEGEYSAYSFAACVHFEHDAGCGRAIHAEDALEYVHHEFHRGVIVVEQDDTEERWSLETRLGLFGDQTAFMLCALFRHPNFAKR